MGLLRKLLWAIANMLLSLSDMAYDLIELVLKVDFTHNTIINNMLKFFNIFILVAVMIRIIVYFIKVMNSDTESFESAKILQGLGRVGVAVALVPSLLWFSLGLPNTIVKVFDNTFTFTAELKPSTSIITSLAYTDISGDITNYEYNKGNVVTIEDIGSNINKKTSRIGGEYIYFSGLAELLLVVVVAILVTIALLLNVSMFITRFFVIMYRYLLSFLPISTLVIPNNSDAFLDFCKSIISDITVQTFSAIGFKFIFALNMSSSLAKQNGIVKILFFILGLTGVVMIGNIISSSIGATDLGNKDRMGKTLLGISSTMALKSSMNVASDVIQSGAELGLDLASGGISALGESLGAKGIDDDTNDIYDDMLNTDDDESNLKDNSSPFDDIVDDNENINDFNNDDDFSNDDIFDDNDDFKNDDIFDDNIDDNIDDLNDMNEKSLYGNVDDDLENMKNDLDMNDDDLDNPINDIDSNNKDTLDFDNDDFSNDDLNDSNNDSDKSSSTNDMNSSPLNHTFGNDNDSIDDLNSRLTTNADDTDDNHNRDTSLGNGSEDTNSNSLNTNDSIDDNTDSDTSLGNNTRSTNEDPLNNAFGNNNHNRDTSLGNGSEDTLYSDNNLGSSGNSTSYNDDTFNDDMLNNNDDITSREEQERLTRPDTFARQIADNIVEIDNPILNLGSKATSHFYVKSQNRYNKSKINKMINPQKLNYATAKDLKKPNNKK